MSIGLVLPGKRDHAVAAAGDHQRLQLHARDDLCRRRAEFVPSPGRSHSQRFFDFRLVRRCGGDSGKFQHAMPGVEHDRQGIRPRFVSRCVQDFWASRRRSRSRRPAARLTRGDIRERQRQVREPCDDQERRPVRDRSVPLVGARCAACRQECGFWSRCRSFLSLRIPVTGIRLWRKLRSSRRPGSSLPTTPTGKTLTPRSARLFTALAPPPGTTVRSRWRRIKDRRFARDARNFAKDEFVRHHVA